MLATLLDHHALPDVPRPMPCTGTAPQHWTRRVRGQPGPVCASNTRAIPDREAAPDIFCCPCSVPYVVINDEARRPIPCSMCVINPRDCACLSHHRFGQPSPMGPYGQQRAGATQHRNQTAVPTHITVLHNSSSSFWMVCSWGLPDWSGSGVT